MDYGYGYGRSSLERSVGDNGGSPDSTSPSLTDLIQGLWDFFRGAWETANRGAMLAPDYIVRDPIFLSPEPETGGSGGEVLTDR